ncbi:hypothetical protein [Gallaecimonas sp. GXIMD4217]|uniref:hypothetical protein n=1 Tax=Gallaecimonas sp. GXIMD4217 TaxID=3131927 RepID=UPI00311AE466
MGTRIWLGLLALMAGPTLAATGPKLASGASPFSYNFVDVGYAWAKLGHARGAADGLQITAVGHLAPDLYLRSSYLYGHDGQGDHGLLKMNLGQRLALDKVTDWYWEGGFARRADDVQGVDHGVNLATGLRHRLTAALELSGEVSLTQTRRAELAMTGGALYQLPKNWALAVHYTLGRRDHYGVLSLRYQF